VTEVLEKPSLFIEAYLMRSAGGDGVAADNDEDDENHLPGAQSTKGTSHKGTQLNCTN
jgi:hypothetical protein